MSLVHAYIDGKLSSTNRVAGIGYLLKTRSGEFVGEGKDIVEDTGNEQTFEIHAAHRAVTAAKEHGYQNIVIRTDSALVANYGSGDFQYGNPKQKQLGKELYERLQENFKDARTTQIKRKYNQYADALAEEALAEYLYDN